MSEITKIEGRLVAETEKAVLIQFKSGKEVWIPKSTLRADYESNKNISQVFLIDTWVLEKNDIIIDENLLVKNIVEKLVNRYSSNLIAIYGIGSFFDEKLPETWIKNDIDLILVVKSIEKIPKEDWDKRFYPRNIEGYDVFTGHNTIEMYQNKQKFTEISGASYEWALIEIRNPENSKLLYGEDIRNKLSDITNLVFDFDDILARGLYHIEKSLKEKVEEKAMGELSKAIFKFSFFICIYFSETFRYTSIIEIEKKLKDIIDIITSIKKVKDLFEESKNFRIHGRFKTEFKILRKNFISFILILLETGVLHRRIEGKELTTYFAKYFGGFPLLLRFLKKSQV